MVDTNLFFDTVKFPISFKCKPLPETSVSARSDHCQQFQVGHWVTFLTGLGKTSGGYHHPLKCLLLIQKTKVYNERIAVGFIR